MAVTETRDRSVDRAAQVVPCSCRSAWCDNAWCRSQAVDRLMSGGRTGKVEDWDFRRVRHFVITVDPKRWDGPEDAYKGTKGDISYLIQRVRRKLSGRGLDVVDYVKSLEWHKSGMPHWHFLVLMNRSGSAAQVGHDVIDACWPHGFVREDYVRDAAHWERLVGYQAKRGYMGGSDKDHQVTLPQWAEDWEAGTIRKGSRAHCRSGDSDEGSEDGEESLESGEDGEESERADRRTYKTMIAECGGTSKLISLDAPGKVYELPCRAEEFREVLVPELMERGWIEFAGWFDDPSGYCLAWKVPPGSSAPERSMDYLWGVAVKVLEDMTGLKMPDVVGDASRRELREAERERWQERICGEFDRMEGRH